MLGVGQLCDPVRSAAGSMQDIPHKSRYALTRCNMGPPTDGIVARVRGRLERVARHADIVDGSVGELDGKRCGCAGGPGLSPFSSET